MSWTTYPIGRPQRQCAATGQPLNPGDRYVATLVESDQTNQIERRDFSADVWAGPRPVQASRLLAAWRAVVPLSDEKPKPILDDDAMLDLFEQLGAETPAEDPSASAQPRSRAALRMVLALMMIRRRLLAHEGNKGTTMLVRPRGVARPSAGGPPLIHVADPGLDAATIDEVLAELESLGVADAPSAPGVPAS